ncbi:MAG: sterol desaturase family protein [Fulvimarina manganoxydans]|uniref:sterol desaturase family protein n=1 Tax=Fulvimarina manganoxydans TaxID=937218 RepID=UPI002357181D|nr:sterol desaturase family protein [Fulvimarina manganoxydans]MCK5932611.1 sterol desaturase family protein [Fulvimarina manganoxydans]
MDPTSWPVLIAIAIGVFFVMEWVAWAAHKYIMHGFGWGWHKSHHEEHDELFEKNDLYAVVFSILAISLFVIAAFGHPIVGAVAVGITLYGLFYFIVHDGLVHQRWPFRHIPHKGYAKRLVQAHRLHHAVEGKDGCVSFGFLYAPPVDKLSAELRSRGTVGEEKAARKAKTADAHPLS